MASPAGRSAAAWKTQYPTLVELVEKCTDPSNRSKTQFDSCNALEYPGVPIHNEVGLEDT
jgi:hypothetical protein